MKPQIHSFRFRLIHRQWKRRTPESPQNSASNPNTRNTAAMAKRAHTRESLLSGLIPLNLLSILVNATCAWWHTWRPLGSCISTSLDEKRTSTLPDFVLWALEFPDPSIVGLALLCIAVCLQQLDTRVHQFIIRQLPQPPGALFQEYVHRVDKYIIGDLDYAGTVEGVEVMALSAKIYST